MTQPRIIIIAGPNGAGKTSFAREFLPREGRCVAFVNADLIAAGLSPFAPEHAAMEAGRLMLKEVDRKVARRETFAIETTLSGVGYARRIPRWRQLGFRIELHFLSLASAELAVQRVALRVRQGGHDIPEDVIRRRYAAGLRLFPGLYQDLVDKWIHYDNSEGRHVPIGTGGIRMVKHDVREMVAGYDGLPLDADEDVRGAYAALRRAAIRARQIARQTGTELVYWCDGKVVFVAPGPGDDD